MDSKTVKMAFKTVKIILNPKNIDSKTVTIASKTVKMTLNPSNGF